mgnify:CR=1 FL=1
MPSINVGNIYFPLFTIAEYKHESAIGESNRSPWPIERFIKLASEFSNVSSEGTFPLFEIMPPPRFNSSPNLSFLAAL